MNSGLLVNVALLDLIAAAAAAAVVDVELQYDIALID